MCGKYFKKNKNNTEHLQKKQKKCWFPIEDIKISDIFCNIQNFLGMLWASIITTYLMTAFGATSVGVTLVRNNLEF